MIETALRAYGDALPTPESAIGGLEEPEALPAAAGAEGLQLIQPAKQTRYISELDASPKHILRMEANHESSG